MATWFDFVSLIITLSIAAGIVYGVMAARQSMSQAVTSTKASLKGKGLDISANGMSVKTKKHLDREEYLDATQRGVMKAMKASSVGRQNSIS